MNKGKIVYIGGFELPDKNAAAHRVINNGKLFQQLGYETIFCGVYKENEQPKYYDKNYFSFKNPVSKYEWFLHIMNSKKYICFLKKIEDVKMVILYNFPSFLSLKILKYCRKKKIKCIADVTEWYSSRTNNFIFNLIKNIDSNLRMKYVNRKMDGLILISSFLNDYYGVNKKNILIPPLVDSSEKKYENVKRTNDNTIRLIYTGDPGKKDNLSMILYIFDKIDNKNLHLDIVGITKEQYIASNNISDKKMKINNVTFYGRVSHNESLNLLKNSDALIFYRDDNLVSKAGFSTKFVEAMTCKVPVIANLTSDLSKYIKDEKNAIILNSNIHENITKLNKVNKDYMNYLKSNVNSKLFDYNNYIVKTKKWIKEILN